MSRALDNSLERLARACADYGARSQIEQSLARPVQLTDSQRSPEAGNHGPHYTAEPQRRGAAVDKAREATEVKSDVGLARPLPPHLPTHNFENTTDGPESSGLVSGSGARRWT